MDEIKQDFLVQENPVIDFIPTGSTLLDLVLGGGFPIGRISNIVGDRSTSKTGLGIEAAANFNIKWPDGLIRYQDVEAAFDVDYARTLGFPEKAEFPEIGSNERVYTVETFFRDFDDFCQRCKDNNVRGLYVLDSLDALSDEDEMKRDISDKTYGATKAKKLSEFFRKLTSKIQEARVHLLIISQVRENIGVMFGEKYSRSGGKALDFYASQVLYLAKKSSITRVVKGVNLTTGIVVSAKTKKNKIAPPFRECNLHIYFNYGIDDIVSCYEWLNKIKAKLPIPDSELSKLVKKRNSLPDDEYADLYNMLKEHTIKNWNEIEQKVMPSRRKYG